MLFKLIKSKPFLIALSFMISIWLIYFLQVSIEFKWELLMLKPRSLSGLVGVFTSELLHGSFQHLISNSLPLFLLSLALFFYYPQLAWKVFIYIVVIGNLWTWVYARESYHLGASGVIYGLASFLFFSGYIRKEKRVMAISLLVVLVYGSLVWGVIPEWMALDWFNFNTTEYKNISWEGHLSGALIGIILAFYFKKIGVQKPEFKWNDDELDNLPPEERYWEIGYQERLNHTNNEEDKVTIKYFYREKDASNT